MKVTNTLKTLMTDIDRLKQAQNIIRDFILKEYEVFAGNETYLFLLLDSFADLSTVILQLDEVFDMPYFSI